MAAWEPKQQLAALRRLKDEHERQAAHFRGLLDDAIRAAEGGSTAPAAANAREDAPLKEAVVDTLDADGDGLIIPLDEMSMADEHLALSVLRDAASLNGGHRGEQISAVPLSDAEEAVLEEEEVVTRPGTPVQPSQKPPTKLEVVAPSASGLGASTKSLATVAPEPAADAPFKSESSSGVLWASPSRRFQTTTLGLAGALVPSSSQKPKKKRSSTSVTGKMQRTSFFQEQAPAYWEKRVQLQKRFTALTLRPSYEAVVLTMIIFNVIFMGVQVQMAAAHNSTDLRSIGYCFTVVFTVDIVLRLATQRLHFFIGEDRQWNLFDSVIVISMIADSARRAHGGSDLASSNFSMLRVLRLVRLLRLLHVLRVLTMFHDFHVLMGTLHRACKSLMWVVLFIIVLLYVMAIAMAEGTLGHCPEDLPLDQSPAICKRFGDVFMAGMSLHQALFNGLDWVRLIDDLYALDAIYPILFMLFLTFGMIILLNVITAVCVGLEEDTRRFEDAQGHDHALASKAELEEKVVERLHRIFDHFDMDGSGDINLNEWVYQLDDKHVQALFVHLEIDVSDPQGLFELLDSSRTGVLERESFVLGCMRLKGTAKTSTLAKLQVKLENIMNDLAQVKTVTSRSVDILKEVHGDKVSDDRKFGEEEKMMVDEQMNKLSCAGQSRFQEGKIKRSIDETAWRAMTLSELRGVRRAIKEQSWQWFDIITGERLAEEDVTLYILNYWYISPATVVSYCTLTGLKPQQVSKGDKVVQLNPVWEDGTRRNWVLNVAEGIVCADSTRPGEVHVKVTQGRFVPHSAFEKGVNIEINGVDFGEPEKVLAPESVSYKEAISTKATKPKWYCSHWWGLSVLDFVASCEEHTRLRKMDERSSSYWVCAYANRQHDLEKEVAQENIADTAFYKAMQASHGVLLILGRKAMPFQRIWCSFELYKTITSTADVLQGNAKSKSSKDAEQDKATKLTLDIAGVLREDGQQRVHLICEEPLPAEPKRAKMVREKNFPHTLLLQGMTRNLEDGKCYSSQDKERILAFMKKMHADKHGNPEMAYEMANQRLNAHFALLVWPFAIENDLVEEFNRKTEYMAAGEDWNLGMKLLGKPPAVLEIQECTDGGWANNWGIGAGDMVVSINGEEVENMTEDEFNEHYKSRPIRLVIEKKKVQTRIEYFADSNTDADDGMILKRNTDLLYEVIDCARGSWAEIVGISAGDMVVGVNGEDLQFMTEEEFIEHRNNRPIRFVVERAQTDNRGKPMRDTALSLVELLQKDKSRTKLDFSVAHFEDVDSNSLSQLAKGLPPNLQDLELSFEGCDQIGNPGLKALARKFPNELKRLQINLMGCSELSDEGIIAMAQQLRRLKKLQKFRLVCYMCPDLTAQCFRALHENMPRSVQKCVVQMKGTLANQDCGSVRELRNAAGGYQSILGISIPGSTGIVG